MPDNAQNEINNGLTVGAHIAAITTITPTATVSAATGARAVATRL